MKHIVIEGCLYYDEGDVIDLLPNDTNTIHLSYRVIKDGKLVCYIKTEDVSIFLKPINEYREEIINTLTQ
tara:strand:- start:33 stop:242 length:210 start_codon:yes stop_codon:yes gene_type:complete